MGANGLDEYWVPEHVKDYLRKLGFVLPLDDMEPWIRSWDDWMSARGEFYDYRDKDGMGRVYAVHRRGSFHQFPYKYRCAPPGFPWKNSWKKNPERSAVFCERVVRRKSRHTTSDLRKLCVLG